MNRVTLLVTLIILGLTPEVNAAEDCGADTEAAREVRAVADGIIAADNSRDLERVLGYYAADAILMPPGERPVLGRQAIRPRYEEMFVRFNPEIEAHVEEVCVDASLAFVRGRNGGRLVSREGGGSKQIDDVYLMMLQHDAEDGWKISHLMWHSAAAQEAIVIHDVTVIDGTGAPPRGRADLVLRGGRIASIESAPEFRHPAGAQVIDGVGKFVIPGLIDMHAHVAGDFLNENGEPGDRWDREVALSLLRTFLQFGVTTVRDPGAITADAILLRSLLAKGELVGPRLFTAGRILSNSDFRPPGFAPVHDEADVRDEIQWQALAGVYFIKIYSSMPPHLTAVAIDEGHRLGLPVIGHLQQTTWTEAARLGIDGVEHAAPWSAAYIEAGARTGAPEGMFGRVYWLQHLDGALIDEMIASLAEHQVVVDPTLMATMYTKFWADDPRWTQNPDLAHVPESLRTGWVAGGFTKDWTPAQFAEAKTAWPILLDLIGKMYERGILLVAGTDTPTPWIVPGASLHDELTLIHEAGIPPLQVIQIATSNAARALRRQHEFGSITPGLSADLVMLSMNPLDDIANTRAIDRVFQNGNVVYVSPQSRQRAE